MSEANDVRAERDRLGRASRSSYLGGGNPDTDRDDSDDWRDVADFILADRAAHLRDAEAQVAALREMLAPRHRDGDTGRCLVCGYQWAASGPELHHYDCAIANTAAAAAAHDARIRREALLEAIDWAKAEYRDDGTAQRIVAHLGAMLAGAEGPPPASPSGLAHPPASPDLTAQGPHSTLGDSANDERRGLEATVLKAVRARPLTDLYAIARTALNVLYRLDATRVLGSADSNTREMLAQKFDAIDIKGIRRALSAGSDGAVTLLREALQDAIDCHVYVNGASIPGLCDSHRAEAQVALTVTEPAAVRRTLVADVIEKARNFIDARADEELTARANLSAVLGRLDAADRDAL